MKCAKLLNGKVVKICLLITLTMISLYNAYSEYNLSTNAFQQIDLFGNSMYPKSVYNTLLGYNCNFGRYYCFVFSLLIISKIYFAFKIENKEIQNDGEKVYFMLSLDFFVICFVALVIDVLIIFSVFPMMNPEIASFEYPMAYDNQYGNLLYYNHPFIHVIISIILRSLIFSMIIMLPMLVFLLKPCRARIINVGLAMLDTICFIYAFNNGKYSLYDVLIPYNNNYYMLRKLIALCTMLIIFHTIFIIYKANSVIKLIKKHIYKINKLKTVKVIGVIFIVLCIFCLKIYDVNKKNDNQMVIKIQMDELFELNNMTISIDNCDVAGKYDLYNSYQITEELDDAKYVLIDLSLKNIYEEKVYFDFANIYIMIGQWFSNLDLDLFYSINTNMKGNHRLCLRPGSTLNVVVPFELMYDENDKKNRLNRIINDVDDIKIYAGKYPVKYEFKINNTLKR